MDEESLNGGLQVFQNEVLGHFIFIGGHVVLDICGWQRLADIVAYISDQIFQERHVPHFLAANDILHEDSVIDALKILPDYFRFVQPHGTKTRQSAVVDILLQGIVVIFQIVENQEFPITESLHEDFNIPSWQQCCQVAGKCVRITACHDNVNVRTVVVIPKSPFKLFYFLHLIN